VCEWDTIGGLLGKHKNISYEYGGSFGEESYSAKN
jgi:hypothetical protein